MREKGFVGVILPVLMGCSLLVKAQDPENPPKQLPNFLFYTLDGNIYMRKNLPEDKHVVIFFFDPYCEHCQAQTKMLTEATVHLSSIFFVFVGTEEIPALKEFENKYLKGKGLHYVVLKDKDYRFDSYFSYSVAPRLFVYDRSGQYRKDFKNEVHPSEILKMLSQ
jgi:thiol-disulfide isomerase/thioredoxin